MDDILCLPTDFVGNSKPSKVIERLYQKKENEQKIAIQQMNQKKNEIGEQYEKLIKEKSEDLKRNLEEIKEFIKNELFEAKFKANYDNASNLDKVSFEHIYKTIEKHTKKRLSLVEEFREYLKSLEEQKSAEFKEVLKETYEDIKKILYKLPCEYDEFIELEIEKINQTILCNHRNYLELTNHLQMEIENDTKHFIEELRYVKECWMKYLRKQTQKASDGLKNETIQKLLLKDCQDLADDQIVKGSLIELKDKLTDSISSIKPLDAHEWLKKVRHTLATVDQNSQKILAKFKQATVLVFNRFFQELKSIAEPVTGVLEQEEIDSIQCEIYTPTLEEIQQNYEQGVETVRKLWDDLTDELLKTVDNTCNFFNASAALWEQHFKRTEVLLAVVLKDIENTIKANDKSSEPYEMKLNILIDTLRQEPTKERLNKTMEDIKKHLNVIEDLYKSQHQIEISTFKKYKSTVDFETDIFIAEVKRFLEVYPPDMEKDPKIQRKRASQTSDIADPTEGLIPNQMMYCKFQVDAVSNWQFGLWEAIKNYLAVAKAEIQLEIDKWIKIQNEKLDKRLQLRLTFHGFRLARIQSYIYETRMEELCIHHSRFEEHKRAVEKRLTYLKEIQTEYCDKFDKTFESYNEDVMQLQSKTLKLPNSNRVTANKIVLKAKTDRYIGEINLVVSEFMAKYKLFTEKLMVSKLNFILNMNLFSENGNYVIQEIKDYSKNLSKIDGTAEKSLTNIKKDIEVANGKSIAKIEDRHTEVLNIMTAVLEEHVFREDVLKKIKSFENEILKEVCQFYTEYEKLTQSFYKKRTENLTRCGEFRYYDKFLTFFKVFVDDMLRIGRYLYHPIPVILYSDKTEFKPFHDTSQMSHPHYSHKDDDPVQRLTAKLINFHLNDHENTLFQNLFKIISNYWDDLLIYSKKFYSGHHNTFFLDQSKLYHSIDDLTADLYDKFCNLQNQCETKWMENAKKYLKFLEEVLKFYQDFIDVYIDEYSRRTLKRFEYLYENQVQKYIFENKQQVKQMYIALHKKLKPLHGHPNNRGLLKDLENEALQIEAKAKDILSVLKEPLMTKIQDFLNKVVDEFYILKERLPELASLLETLSTTQENLTYMLSEKVQLLRSYVTCQGPEFTAQPLIMDNSKSFLELYDKKDTPRELMVGEVYGQNSTLKSASTNKSLSVSKTPEDLSVTILSIHIMDEFLMDLRESFDRYCREIEEENFEELQEKLKKEWRYAVDCVLNLYKVKYDQ